MRLQWGTCLCLLPYFLTTRFLYDSDKTQPVTPTACCRNVFTSRSFPFRLFWWAAGVFVLFTVAPGVGFSQSVKILSLRREQKQWFFIRSVGTERIVGLGILLLHPSFFSSFFSPFLLVSNSGFLPSRLYTFYSLYVSCPVSAVYVHLVFIFFLPHPSNFQYQLVSISLSILAQ